MIWWPRAPEQRPFIVQTVFLQRLYIFIPQADKNLSLYLALKARGQ
jgi:hypothetical protein